MLRSTLAVVVAVVIVMGWTGQASAETLTVDLATYTVPDGWTVEAKPRSYQRHTEVDQANKRYCALAIYVSTRSSGTLAADFEADWTMAVAPLGKTSPVFRKAPPIEGWQGRGAQSAYVDSNGFRSTVFVHTYSSGTQRITFMATTNQPRHYQRTIDAFFRSIRLPAPAAPTTTAPPTTPAPTGAKRTNFDDGWVAIEEADWVRVTRGAVTVLIHHAAPDLRPFTNPWEGTSAVWNQLVAPRYAGVANLTLRRGFWDDGDAFGQSKHFASATARDAQGQSIHVALFRGGNGRRWIEIITPDKATFEKQLTVVRDQDGTDFEPLNKLATYNKFAVAAADLVGGWTSSSGAGIEYVNVYTGGSAGFHHASSTSRFTFRADGSYASEWVGAQNTGGATQFGGEWQYTSAAQARSQSRSTSRRGSSSNNDDWEDDD